MLELNKQMSFQIQFILLDLSTRSIDIVKFVEEDAHVRGSTLSGLFGMETA